MNHVHHPLLRIGVALTTAAALLTAFTSFAAAAPGGTRPGWGCGDRNHVHTGPPGLGATAVSPCGRGVVTPPTASIHFSVSAPTSVSAGSAFTFTVTALNQNNDLVGLTDVLHFTSTDTVAGVSLPTDMALTNGSGSFTATLVTAGNQTITATDTANAGITGTSNTIAVSAIGATHLAISVPATATHGTAFNFTVTALDQFGNTAAGFGDTLHFTTSDGAATLPADSTLTSGSGTFTATLNTTGSQTITATDTANGSIAVTSAGIVVS